jgi:hypothetical protein
MENGGFGPPGQDYLTLFLKKLRPEPADIPGDPWLIDPRETTARRRSKQRELTILLRHRRNCPRCPDRLLERAVQTGGQDFFKKVQGGDDPSEPGRRSKLQLGKDDGS